MIYFPSSLFSLFKPGASIVLTPFIAIKYLNLVVSMNYKVRLVMRSTSQVFLVKFFNVVWENTSTQVIFVFLLLN